MANPSREKSKHVRQTEWIWSNTEPPASIRGKNQALARWCEREAYRILFDLFIIRNVSQTMCASYEEDNFLCFTEFNHINRYGPNVRKLREAITEYIACVGQIKNKHADALEDPAFLAYVQSCSKLFTRMVDQLQRALAKIIQLGDYFEPIDLNNPNCIDISKTMNQRMRAFIAEIHADLDALETRVTQEQYTYMCEKQTDDVDQQLQFLTESFTSLQVQ